MICHHELLYLSIAQNVIPCQGLIAKGLEGVSGVVEPRLLLDGGHGEVVLVVPPGAVRHSGLLATLPGGLLRHAHVPFRVHDELRHTAHGSYRIGDHLASRPIIQQDQKSKKEIRK